MKNLVERSGTTATAFAPLVAAIVALGSACSSGDTTTPPYVSGSGAGSVATAAAGGTATTSSGATGTAGAGTTTGTTGTTATTGTAGAGTTTTTTTSGAAGSTTTGGTAGGGAAAGPATFTSVLKIFTDANCGLCHGMATLGGGLIFKPSDPMGAYTALVGPVSAGTNSSMCAGKTYVVPGNPDGSLLYGKLQATPPCGARMPATGVFLMDDQLKTIHDWIMAGAKND
jgi:hypothetical protein